MIYALIPARGGSKRIPRKNLERVGGLTLVARAVRAALRASLVDRVYVSTEDGEIAKEARHSLAYVVDRPVALAAADVPMEAVVEHFIQAVGAKPNDTVVVLEPTAPLRMPHDIDSALTLMRLPNVPAVRFVAAVEPGCHPVTYRDAGLANAVRVGEFLRSGCLFPSGTLLLHYGDERAIDVDTPADLERARALA